MMRKSNFILGLLLIGLNCTDSLGQLPDGTRATATFIQEINKNLAAESASDFDKSNINLWANLSLSIHVVKNKMGLPGIGVSTIQTSVTDANNYFKTIGIQFVIDKIDYIEDYNYSSVSKSKNMIELLTKHAENNKINLFLVDSIQINLFAYYGFTYFPNQTDSNFIFLCKNEVNGVSLSTQLGHFFGLLSTHETAGGRELVNESNCKTSGDFLCDTYADPDIFSLVDSACKYSGILRDPAGLFYVPSVANIMSNSPFQCKCIFTPFQYRRMYFYYKKFRQYLE
jgi:hypothetical protein